MMKPHPHPLRLSHLLRVPIGTGLWILAGLLPLSAQTWTPTAAGTTYDWNVNGNWSSSPFPDAAGAVANVNNNILGAQTIRLQEAITLGVLNFGDSAASGNSFAFTISQGTGTNLLTFDSNVVDQAAQLNLSSSGTPLNIISAGIALNSDLVLDMAGVDASNRQRIRFGAASGSPNTAAFNLGSRTLSIENGILGGSEVFVSVTSNLNGDADSRIVNNSRSVVFIEGSKADFLGTVEVNNHAAASNAAGLTLTANGSLLNAKEFIVNGYLTNGVTQNGGTVHVGNNSAVANPGQRLTQNRITMNGGNLFNAGQNLSDTSGTVSDTVANFDFNSGMSLVTMGVSNGSSGTELTMTALERSLGASGVVRSNVLGSTSTTPGSAGARIFVGNSGDFLLGAGGGDGSTTMSIIPWLTAAAISGSGDVIGFLTYDSVATDGLIGLRALTAGEYASSITAGVDHNVSTNAVALAANATVNALRHTATSVQDLGAGHILSISSGGLIFDNNGAGIGVSGSADAGTLNFETAEAVIWATTDSAVNNTNTIGSIITGSGGLSKAGTGTLILTGENEYTGHTYVGSGTLIIGDGTHASNLGLTGGVTVASGALLSLMNDGAINDTVVLTLQSFGLFNGRVSIAAGLDEIVGGLYLGDTYYSAGTFGAVGSGAGFESDQWFAGSGIITVVPEPSAAVLIGLGAGMFLLRRRRC